MTSTVLVQQIEPNSSANLDTRASKTLPTFYLSLLTANGVQTPISILSYTFFPAFPAICTAASVSPQKPLTLFCLFFHPASP